MQSIGLKNHLEAVITANSVPATAPTAAPTVSVTGGGSTGGLLAAGAYYCKITEHNGIGETTASPETTSFTVAAGNIPQVTFPSLKSGNTARNVYITAAGGGTGTEVLYASGITAATYNLAVAAPSSTTVPPTSSGGALSTFQVNLIRELGAGKTFQQIATHVNAYLGGDPMTAAEGAQRISDYSVIYSTLASFLAEVGTLLIANPGSLHNKINGAGNSVKYRTFP